MNYKTGLVSISFRPHTPEEILSAMSKCGLTYIEWGSDVHAPCNDLEKLDTIIKLQKQYGVQCCSYGTYFRVGVTPITELESYMDAALVLGTKILRLWCGDKNSEDYTPEEKRYLFDQCRQAAQMAEERNMILCMECHNNTYTNRKEGAMELMESIDSEHFRMYWQPNQFRSEAENLESAKLLAPYVVNIHAFNWQGHENQVVDRYPLKEAVELWKQYLEYFNGEQVLMLEFMPDDRLESLDAEATALREIAG